MFDTKKNKTITAIKRLSCYVEDKQMVNLLECQELWDAADDYLRLPRGYAETDKMSEDEALHFLNGWLLQLKLVRMGGRRDYNMVMKETIKRIQNFWIQERGCKGVGRQIARLHYHLNK